MSIKLLIFDLDGTLCGIGKPVLPHTLDTLRRWENEGLQLAICSGKPTYYLCGMARQLDLSKLIMVGENGIVLQFGVDLPPREKILEFPQSDMDMLAEIKSRIKKEFGNEVWLQPNTIALTCFFKDEEQQVKLRSILHEELAKRTSSIQMFEQVDCFDLLPDLNKGDGVKELMRQLNIAPCETVAVGDGENDYPMFAEVGTAIGIGLPKDERITYAVKDISEALDVISSLLG